MKNLLGQSANQWWKSAELRLRAAWRISGTSLRHYLRSRKSPHLEDQSISLQSASPSQPWPCQPLILSGSPNWMQRSTLWRRKQSSCWMWYTCMNHLEEKLEQTNKLLADFLESNIWFSSKVLPCNQKEIPGTSPWNCGKLCSAPQPGPRSSSTQHCRRNNFKWGSSRSQENLTDSHLIYKCYKWIHLEHAHGLELQPAHSLWISAAAYPLQFRYKHFSHSRYKKRLFPG